MKKVLTMIPVIILSASLSASLSSFATDKDNSVNQKKSYQTSFTKLKVEDGIDVVLIDSPEKAIEFEGSETNIARVDWKIQDGVMHISSKGSSLKGKVKVIVNVNRLSDIYVKDGAAVSSSGKLNSASLNVNLDGDSFISVRTTGVIHLFSEEDTDMEVRKAAGNIIFG